MNDEHGTRTQGQQPGVVDRLRVLTYLSRVDFRLSLHGIGRSLRRQINVELKANVLEAARDHGSLSATFAALGSPRELAHAYADADPHRGFIHHGAAIWALASFVVLQAVGIGISVGFSRGAEAAGVTERVSYRIEFVSGMGPFSGSYAPDPTVAAFALVTPAHLVIVLVAALLGGRVWRALRRR